MSWVWKSQNYYLSGGGGQSQSHDAMITSLLCQNDVATSFWRNNDVFIASSVRWQWVNVTYPHQAPIVTTWSRSRTVNPITPAPLSGAPRCGATPKSCGCVILNPPTKSQRKTWPSVWLHLDTLSMYHRQISLISFLLGSFYWQIRAWTSNFNHSLISVVITCPCLTFNGCLTEPPLKFGCGRVITYHSGCNYSSMS